MSTWFPSTPPGPGPLVLLIEPDADTRDMMRIWLELEGFGCAEPHADESDMAALQRVRPDAVVVTITPPVDSGLALVGRLHAVDSGPGRPPIPFVALSAVDLASRVERVGADAYLKKPVDMHDLLELLRRRLS